MESINYTGEHLWPGYIGHFAVILGFVAALAATIAYFMATQRRELAEGAGWQRIGRIAFGAHALGVFGTIGMLFYVMINQYYEYQYVQAHVSDELPLKYIFSAFWEGQEGSFLLWMFWHVVLGLVLIRTARTWESPVLSVLSFIQVFVSSMLLGIYVGWGDDPMKIGANPTLLLREVMDAPIFAKENYIELIKGNGLNPLLQNYWMTIHPPTLFLGFASTAVPFAFAIAGLWTRRHTEWLRAVMPWALFCGAILGTGILMGGAWAYEALSFGGYWAWDPVENMSLVPWLILLAGIHTNLISRNTGYAIKSTYIYYLLTFIFVVYSTFLTRSGVLGDTSVHAFTEMGLEWQLVLFITAFVVLSTVFMVSRYRGIPTPEKEEPISSKEFWIFIGTLVLLFSAVIITASTSLPVYNKIVKFFDPTFQGKVITEPIAHYNKYQVWIAVFIGLLSGFAQYLRFRESQWTSQAKRFYVHVGAALAISAVLTYLTTLWIETKAWQYSVLLYAGWFALVSNIDFLAFFIKGKLKVAGSVFSHVGFGLMLIGILASGLNKRTISVNPFVMDGLIEGADEEGLRNNILLFKGTPVTMGDYEVTYVKDTLNIYTRSYTVNYKKKDPVTSKVVEEFNLHPNVLYDKSFTKIAASNPSTKRYFGKDIFTHIASLPQVEMDMEFRQRREDSLHYQRYDITPGQSVSFLDTVPIRDQDTFTLKTYTIEVEQINRQPSHPDYQPQQGDIAIGARLKISREGEDSVFVAEPMLVVREQMLYNYPVQINELSSKVRLNEEVFAPFFVSEDKLGYQEFTFKAGDSVRLNNMLVRFTGFNKQPSNPAYQAEKGDIAVSAMLDITTPDGRKYTAEPVYLIRGSQPFNLKDELPAIGFHARFIAINPETESATLMLAQQNPAQFKVPVEMTTDSLRSDYIVLEAISFPGINLFWLGSLMMMIGLGMAMWNRIKSAHAA